MVKKLKKSTNTLFDYKPYAANKAMKPVNICTQFTAFEVHNDCDKNRRHFSITNT